MKRALPSSSTSIFGSSSGSAAYPGALRFVEVSQLDTPEGQTSWKEREKETLFVRRFAEADTKLHITRPESGGHTYTEPGSHGPRPSTTFLKSTERYFPTDIPGPIKASPNETAAERDARKYNNQWRALQRQYAKRGAADPTYKSLDFMGDQSTSRAFGFDADKFTTRPRMMTNYNALDERQFERFVERIRSGRQGWRSFFRTKERGRLLALIRKRQEKAYAAAVRANEDAERRGEPKKQLPKVNPEAELNRLEQGELDMLEQSRDVDATRDAFRMLEERAVRHTTLPSSSQLPGSSQPSTLHPHAGLQFSQPDPIYTSLLAEPLPGRVVHEVSSKSDRDVRKALRIPDGRSVLLGGHVSYLHAPLRSNAPPTIDWSRQEPTRGSALFRIVDAYRSSSLTLATGMHRDMLAPRNDLGYLRSNLELVKQDAQGRPLARTAPLGSAAYVGEVVQDPSRPVRRALGGVEPRRSGLGALNALYATGPTGKNDLQKQRKLGRLPRLQPATGQDSTRKMLDNLDSLVSAARKS